MEQGRHGGAWGPHFSRRQFVGAGLALTAASALPMRAFAAAVPATPAKRFVDTVGICTHPHWRTTLWGSTDWESLFLETGVMHTRGKIGRGTGGKAAVADLQKLFSAGVKICATVADPKLDRVATKANLDFLASHVGAQNLSGIESANEFNNPKTKPANWAAQLRDFQKWLRDTVRANSAFNNVPLVAPSIWGRLTWDYVELGNLEPNVDRGCMHWYTGGRRPSIAGSPSTKNVEGGSGWYTMADAIREAKVLAPTKRLYITEYGHPIAGPDSPLSGYVITETAAAKYMPRGLLDAFGEGVEKISIYSLIDDVNRSKYHGLADRTLTPRLTFNAVKNLMALFRDAGSMTSAGSLDFSLSGLTSSIKQQLFQKSDGAFLLTMYQDVDSYDRANKRDTIVEPVLVGLSLAQAASIQLFTPTMGSGATKSVTNATALTIPVGDHVTVVKITQGGGALTTSSTTTTATTTQSTSTTTAAPTRPAVRDPFEFRIPPERSD